MHVLILLLMFKVGLMMKEMGTRFLQDLPTKITKTQQGKLWVGLAKS